jgi:hypothetical protein
MRATRKGTSKRLGKSRSPVQWAIGPAGQQHAEFFKAFPNGRDGLRQVQVVLRGAAFGLGMAHGVHPAAWKYVSAGGKSGTGGRAG